eukprot:5655604-Ditylum_brightwellii.AAC.2
MSCFGTSRRDSRQDGLEETTWLDLLQDKVSTLDTSVEHVSGMLGAIKGQSDMENITNSCGPHEY